MRKIEELETIEKENGTYAAYGINPTFGAAYFRSRDNSDEMMDFGDSIWIDQIPDIIRDLKRFGFKGFTVSSTCTTMADILKAFEDGGCRLKGLTQINSRLPKWYPEDCRQKVNAFEMSIE